jgi:hypothetical protein
VGRAIDVADDDVGIAPVLAGDADRLLDTFLGRHVDVGGDRLAARGADAGDDFVDRFMAARSDDDAAAFASEVFRHRAAHALAAATRNGDLAPDPEIHRSLLRPVIAAGPSGRV